MKPELKTRSVTKVQAYWTCNCPEHYHRAEYVAEACIKNSLAKEALGKNPKRNKMLATFERQLEVFDLYVSGSTIKELAELFKVSISTITNDVFKITAFLDRYDSNKEEYKYRGMSKANLKKHKQEFEPILEKVKEHRLEYINSFTYE